MCLSRSLFFAAFIKGSISAMTLFNIDRSASMLPEGNDVLVASVWVSMNTRCVGRSASATFFFSWAHEVKPNDNIVSRPTCSAPSHARS